jgi:hypothetical protein
MDEQVAGGLDLEGESVIVEERNINTETMSSWPGRNEQR